MPSGKVKWYDAGKGFGFLSQEGGEDVYVRAEALPDGVETLRPRQRVEFDMVSGRRGPQALRVELVEEPKSPIRSGRPQAPKHSPDELHGMISDLISVLESNVQQGLRSGRRPDPKVAARIAEAMRAVARELDA